jgi:hypothetical protein
MNAGSEDRAAGVARYQIACLSCGYHQAWPTCSRPMPTVIVTTPRHRATPALPAGSGHGGIDERERE